MARPSALTGNHRRHAIKLVKDHGGAMASRILNADADTELASFRSTKLFPEGVYVSPVTLLAYAHGANAKIRTTRGRRPNNLVKVDCELAEA